MPPGSHSNVRDDSDEGECPVCLEPLSFSFRLPGEKPHIVPECGHALHEACFTAVYGPAKNAIGRNRSVGVCGVCRRPMKVGDGDGGKSNKLAALTGMGDRNPMQRQLYPGRDTPTGNGRGVPAPKPYDPNEDDPLEHASSLKNGASSTGQDQATYVVAPSITVRPEFSTLHRTPDASQPLTCIVVVELPSRRSASAYPRPTPPEAYASTTTQGNGRSPVTAARLEAIRSAQSSPRPDQFHRDRFAHGEPPDPLSPRSQGSSSNPRSPQEQRQQHHDGYGYEDSIRRERSGASVVVEEPEDMDEPSPFEAITEDLRNRIIDWKGHPLSSLGPLQMYDMLRVRRESIIREFFVYLFKEAIICVMEEKKRSLGRLLSGVSGSSSSTGDGASIADRAPARGVLRLRGRIYIGHIRQVTDSSTPGELSLTIDMEDERLDSFILVFRERSSLETWRSHINRLVQQLHARNNAILQQQQPQQLDKGLDIEEFGVSSKAARMLSGSTGTTSSSARADSVLDGSGRSIASSTTSHSGLRGAPMPPAPPQYQHKPLSTLGEDEELSQYDPAAGFVTPHVSHGPSNSLSPVAHAPLDLILVVSVPPASAVPSTAALKIRVIKNALDFVIAQLGQRDRLSVVTFEMGAGGRVRKTPFLSLGKTQSRARLGKFVDEIGMREDDGTGWKDEFAVRTQDEKTDVVTAINHGLDVVLQRKSRNPVSGMILISDAAEATRRAQMDLVLARAEAANMPIHSFGYGRSHDPASLWLVSNNTGGTYTFVRDWYGLQGCLAGCVGGMMSIGLVNMKLHLKIVDGSHFQIRKVSGGPNAILSSDGRHVDIDFGELRYGERKEMLVELELDNSDAHRQAASVAALSARDSAFSSDSGATQHPPRAMNATDQFVAQMGLDALSIGDSPDLVDGMMDRMIDEVPVFEVDGSFFDPAAAKHVSRLAHPVLLTVTLLPANPNMRTPQPPPAGSDPVIVRRRMEILTGDMITRALVLVSRKNMTQAKTIMSETHRVLNVVLQTVSQALPPPSAHAAVRNRKEILTLAAMRCIQAMLQDLQILAGALEESPETFALDQRNFGAQQAMILRDQKSWTGRSAVERVFWTIDNSIELSQRSADWVARD